MVALTFSCLESTPLAERGKEENNVMIALDCEMSGLDPLIHSILSIGAVDLENPSRTFYGECYLPEQKTFQVEALAVNGFTESQIFDKSKDSLKSLMTKFYKWLQDCNEKTLVGQNVSLDRAFLNTAFIESEIPFQFHYRIVDIHSVAVGMFLRDGRDLNIEDGRIKMSLDKIAEAVGLSEEPRPHNALTGATYNAEVFTRLVYKKNLVDQFKDFPIFSMETNTYYKNFDSWNVLKKQVNEIEHDLFAASGEIWWCSLGVNIGSEQDGVGEHFERPVLIIKKVSKNNLLIAPLTTKDKKSIKFKVELSKIRGYVLLDQIKVIDKKRLKRSIEKLPKDEFLKLIEVLKLNM